MSNFLRLRRSLLEPIRTPSLAPGYVEVPLWKARPIELHQLLVAAYADGGGVVGRFDDWFWPLVEDAEFDPALVTVVADAEGAPVGLVQSWTSGFIKDIVVSHDCRNSGIGSWLLLTAFDRLRARFHPHADLKVEIGNLAAQRFYARHGMIAIDP